MSAQALDRDALYYPRIHIPDVNWLKSTLLCFPRVVRIVPRFYALEDNEEVREFTRLQGPRGPLLDCADLFNDTVRGEQRKLIRGIKDHEDQIIRDYSERSTREKYGWEADQYEIHGSKVMPELAEYLKENQLAWDARGGSRWQWLAVNPMLGKAIMGSLAVGIAKAQGLDIVTPDDEEHYGLVRSTDDDVFGTLVGERAAVPKREDMVDDLCEVVLSSTFDVSKLSPRTIAAMINDGHDLRDFKKAISEFVSDIPPMSEEKYRTERLNQLVEEVRNQWEGQRRSLPRVALDALVDATDVKWPELASSFITGTTSISRVGLGVGLGIALITYSGAKVVRKFRDHLRSPYRYLSKIHKSGAILSSPVEPRGKGKTRKNIKGTLIGPGANG